MTGSIVDFGGKRTPSLADAGEALNAARTALPEHDPFQPVLDGLQTLVGTMERAAARIEAGPVERPLTREQMALLTNKVGAAAERGVERYANRISGWRAVIVGAVGAGGLFVGAGMTYVINAQLLETTLINTQTAIGALSTADAGDWAKLIRLNSPPRQWTSKQPIVAEDGSNAAWVLLRMDPVPRTQPPEKKANSR